jgi:poly-gamma-glutamate synthesis protein (capsule biosynthesis protein)
VLVTTAAGVRVGIVAGTFGTNGFPLPTGREWSVSLWDAPNLLAQAHAARRAGADVVVVHLHGGDEYSHLPNAAQVALVDRLTRSPDVDLVLGDHAHVVQPITKVNGKWVVYGMGNMVAQQDPARADTYQGILVRFTFTERRSGRFAVTRAAYVPIGWNVWQPGSPIRVVRLHGSAAAEVASDVLGLGAVAALHAL